MSLSSVARFVFWGISARSVGVQIPDRRRANARPLLVHSGAPATRIHSLRIMTDLSDHPISCICLLSEVSQKAVCSSVNHILSSPSNEAVADRRRLLGNRKVSPPETVLGITRDVKTILVEDLADYYVASDV